MEEMRIRYLKLMSNMVILFFLFFCGCNENKSKSQMKDKVKLENKRDTVITVKPDLMASGLVLLDTTSFQNITKKKIDLIEGIREFSSAIFLNENKSQYLIASHYEGDVANCFSLFEIGYKKDEPSFDSLGIKTQIDGFVTESGLELGMSLVKLIELKGKGYKKSTEGEVTILSYTIQDLNDAFLQKARAPGYYINIYLKKDKVHKIIFGFEYP